MIWAIYQKTSSIKKRDIAMECPKCKSEIQKGDKFCRECGEKLPSLCPECGSLVDSQDKFCSSCGTKLGVATDTKIDIPRLEDMHSEMQRFIPQSLSQRMIAESSQMAGENRLITALFADISGFTSLSNQNSPERVVNIVNQCFKAIVDAIYHYEGSVNRFIGDNVLAFFWRANCP